MVNQNQDGLFEQGQEGLARGVEQLRDQLLLNQMTMWAIFILGMMAFVIYLSVKGYKRSRDSEREADKKRMKDEPWLDQGY